MGIYAIWAEARDAQGRPVIGRDGGMPWHLPGDLAHFKELTDGATVIMGRRTWESLPPAFRPLPGRSNIVVTSHSSIEDAMAADSLESALEMAATMDDAADAWIIGGGTVYSAAMGIVDGLEVTQIDLEVEGDTFAPEIPADAFTATSISDWRRDGDGPRYRFVTYARR